MPSGDRSRAPPTISERIAPMRTIRNSSRLLAVMPRNFTRSSSGTVASSASASTRRLNSSQLSSRLERWSLTRAKHSVPVISVSCRMHGAMLPMSPRRRRFVTAGVMTGMLLAALESTVVGAAMPTIVAALGGLAHYSWVFSAYLLASTVTVPVWGKLSDLFGRRLLFQIGVGVFLFGSAACGLSMTMTQLIVARSIQGIGAGALVPLAMTIIGDIFTLEE